MIIVKIWGGLGNQMFQYAAAKALSFEYKVNLKLDISHYSNPGVNETLRDFKLKIFPKITEEIASSSEIRKCVVKFKEPLFNQIYKSLIKKIPGLNTNYLIETSQSYKSLLIRNFDFTYMDGYWQSEEYFKKYRKEILDIFSLNYLQNIGLAKKIKEINEINSVSIHVRRGDYVSNFGAHSFHGVCSINYYERAITSIIDKVDGPIKFYIFSDDISWCKENLKIGFDHEYITNTEDYHDLYLMSQCKHNIVANSSFSWWASWINSYENRIIIAPKNWFADARLNNIASNTWLKI